MDISIIVLIAVSLLVGGFFVLSGIMYSKTSNGNPEKHKLWKILLIISAVPTVIMSVIVYILPFILIFMLPLMSM